MKNRSGLYAAAVVILGLVVLTGCASTSESAGVGVSDGVTPSSPDATASPVDSCADLLAGGWKAPERFEPDISWDPSTGEATITFGDGSQLHINVLTDEKCRDLPDIGPIIARLPSAAADDLASECQGVVEQILSGEDLAEGTKAASRQALLDYLKADCPPEYLDQIPPDVLASVGSG